MRKIKYAALLVLALFPVASIAQDENVRGVVRAKNGYLMIWNEPQNNFTLFVDGKDFEKVSNQNPAFLIDGKFLQITSALRKDILMGKERKDLNDQEFLLAHRDWEAAYLGQKLKEGLKVDSEAIKIGTNKDALLWSFPVPESSRAEVSRQVMLTIVNGDSVIVLNGAVTRTDNEATVRKFLMGAAATLKVSQKALSREDAAKLASQSN